MKKLILLSVAAATLFTSCQKNNNPIPAIAPGAKSNALIVPVTPIQPPIQSTDVYIAGAGIFNKEESTAAYWKNGTYFDLSDVTGAQATGIVVSGTNVYVSGEIPLNFGQTAFKAVYWLNGTEVDLSYPGIPNYSSGASDIAINGSDIYVVGSVTNLDNDKTIAVIWKNGVPTSLAYNNYYSAANRIVIHNNTVYVTGVSSLFATSSYTGTYWINNVPHLVRTGTGYSEANGIAFDPSGNFYISGYIGNSGAYWVNGIYQYLLSSPNSYSQAYGITYYGSSLYIAGTADDANGVPHACYWENDTFHQASSDRSMGYDIQFSNTVRYEMAYLNISGGYYRNGLFTSITDCAPNRMYLVSH